MLPPVAALLVVGTWLGVQRRAILTAQQDCVMLRRQLAAAVATPPPTKAAASDHKAKAGMPINWQTLAKQLDETQQAGATADMRVMLRFQQRLQAMTREELIAGLNAIPALELSANSRSMLEQTLIGPLIEIDPEYVLTHFTDSLQDEASGLKWHLPNAMREWAKQEPAKAGAWLDEQIAAGKFDSKSLDGKNPFRVQFEEVMLGILFPADPATAGLRLSAMPQDQRGEVMKRLLGSVKEETQAAFTQLVRDQVPANEQTDIFAQQVANQAGKWLAQGGYAKVSDYLDRIGATPAERSACALQVAVAGLSTSTAPVTRENIDALRTWIDTQAPDSTNRFTGNILATATQIMPMLEFNDAAALALQYSQTSGSDDVLGTFLESWTARNHKDLALAFVGDIVDEKRRAAILKSLQ